MSDYRKRFFSNYMSTQVEFVEKITPESFAIVAKGFKKYITPHLPEDKNASILDVACGPGHLLHFLQNEGYHNAHGIDIGTEQLEMACKMGVKNVQQADLFDYLRKQNEKFDLIIALNIIEHLTKAEAVQALDLVYASLAPKGKILVVTPNVNTMAGLWATFGDFTHELVFTARSLAQLLRVCSYSEVNVFGLDPFAHDFRSTLRAVMWKILKKIYKLCFIVERGTGRSFWESKPMFSGSILATGEKKGELDA